MDEVARGDAQGVSRLSHPSRQGMQHIKSYTGSRPETRVLATEAESPASIQARPVRMAGQCVGRQFGRRKLITNLQLECLTQSAQGPRPVLVLRPALLRDNDQPARSVAQPHRRTRLVSFLSARTAGAIGIHSALAKKLRIA